MGLESWKVRLRHLWKYCSKRHLLNGRKCRTPARKDYGNFVSQERVGMHCRKTERQSALLKEAKASSDCDDGPTLLRRDSLPLRGGGDSRAHQNIPRLEQCPAQPHAPS